MDNQPLVCIGIPTRNRPEMLKKAVDSCLAQTYKNIVIFISDNCSDNSEVDILCTEYAKNDSRIKYVRQEENIGMGANGQYLVDNALGEYYFTMGDDDWISDNFIEECMKVMLSKPNCSLVCGQIKLYDEHYNLAKHDCHAEHMNQDNYTDRIESYYDQLWSFLSYGIRKISELKKIDRAKGRMCEDWIETTKFIFFGEFYVLDNCTYHKLWTGSTATMESVIESYNLPKSMNYNGLMKLYATIARDAILKDDFYSDYLTKKERVDLAKVVYKSIYGKRNSKLHQLNEITKYMWQHPLFLFKAKFYSIFYPEIYRIVRYMWRHPLFLFRAEFYSTFFPKLYKIVRYMWRHPLFLLKEDFYEILLNKLDLKNLKPLVSVEIPTYNRRDMLEKALNSVINQTYTNLEIIISDNHSDDRTEEFCREYMAKDSRIKYFRHDENIGMTENGNFAAQQVTGEYWLGISDDDWVDLDYVEKLMSFALKHPDYEVIFPLTKLYDKDYNLIDTAKMHKLDYENINKRVKKFIEINLSTFCIGLYKTNVLKTMQKFDNGMFKHRLCEDWVFIIKYLVSGKGKMLDNVYYHKVHNGLTKDLEGSKKLWGRDDLNGNNFWDKLGMALSDAILEDKFFSNYLNEKERKKLARIAYQAALSYKIKAIKTYILRHPFFLSRKDFWTLLKNNI